MTVLDAGCGIGGPMRAIARFSRTDVVGVTISEYQVNRGNFLNRKYGLDRFCRLELGNFMDLGASRAEAFDAAYAVEATCHAPDKLACYREIFNTLKPGAAFVAYEWVVVRWRPRSRRPATEPDARASRHSRAADAALRREQRRAPPRQARD